MRIYINTSGNVVVAAATTVAATVVVLIAAVFASAADWHNTNSCGTAAGVESAKLRECELVVANCVVIGRLVDETVKFTLPKSFYFIKKCLRVCVSVCACRLLAGKQFIKPNSVTTYA